MNIIIAGSRTVNPSAFPKYEPIITQAIANLMDFRATPYSKLTIISGGAQGADTIGELYAQIHGFNLIVMKADWQTHGRRAGYKRNLDMAKVADAVFAIWDGQSRGTEHMLRTMRQAGKFYAWTEA